MKFIKTCTSFVWAHHQCASRFYEGLTNAHLLFMSPWKYAPGFMKVIKDASLLDERFNNVHHGFTKAWAMRISFLFLWVLEKHVPGFMEAIRSASPLRERFNHVHHGFTQALTRRIALLWVFQKIASRFMKFIKTCTSVVGPLEQCASPVYAAPEKLHILISEPL